MKSIAQEKVRIFRPLRSRIREFSFLAFDIETYVSRKFTYLQGNRKEKPVEEQKFLCGSVVYDTANGSVRKIFWDRQQMLDYMMDDRYKDHIMVCTSLGFDVPFLLGEEMCRFENTALKYGDYMGRRFWDVLSFSAPFMSVKAQGDIVKLPKLPYPKCFLRDKKGEILSCGLPKDDEQKKELETYCIRDSEITLRFSYLFQKMCKDLGCQMRPTIAQSTIDIFRRKYLKQPIFCDDKRRVAFSRLSYKGGRTETFQRGTFENVYIYDVNSMYPYIMKTLALPDPSSGRWVGRGTIENIKKKEGCSSVDIHIPQMLIPPLPITKEDRLIFPVGTISGTWTHYELRYAISLGCVILKVSKQLIYDRTLDDFQNFADDLYTKRMEIREKGGMDFLVKLFLNSCYGKLGQNPDNFDVVKHISACSEREMRLEKTYITDDYVSIKEEDKEIPAFINPIWASYITSGARVYLHQMMNKNPQNVLYCDTDSVFMKRSLSRDDRELGGWKFEGLAGKVLLIRPKAYEIQDKDYGKGKSSYVKLKGFSRIDHETFSALIEGRLYSVRKMSGYRESIRKGIPQNSFILMEKVFNVEDKKRLWPAPFDKRSQQISQPLSFGTLQV